MTKEIACLQAEKNTKHLKRKLADSNDWTFQYLNPHTERWEESEPTSYRQAVALRRYYLINAARHLLGKWAFSHAETAELTEKKWQYYV